MTFLEVLIALILPPLAVAMKKGFSSKVLIALLLQLCGHNPGDIYGISVVTRECAAGDTGTRACPHLDGAGRPLCT